MSKIYTKIFNFYNLRKICIMHELVFLMHIHSLDTCFIITDWIYLREDPGTCSRFSVINMYEINELGKKEEAYHSYLSQYIRKPTICICENKGADQFCGYREANQCLCFRYTDSTIPLLLKSKISSF